MININWDQFIRWLTIGCAFALVIGFVAASFLWV